MIVKRCWVVGHLVAILCGILCCVIFIREFSAAYLIGWCHAVLVFFKAVWPGASNLLDKENEEDCQANGCDDGGNDNASNGSPTESTIRR